MMKPELSEQLLNDLISGLITPEEFRDLAAAPVFSVVYFPESEGQAQRRKGEIKVIVDGIERQMQRQQFEAFRHRFPSAEYVEITFYQ